MPIPPPHPPVAVNRMCTATTREIRAAVRMGTEVILLCGGVLGAKEPEPDVQRSKQPGPDPLVEASGKEPEGKNLLWPSREI